MFEARYQGRLKSIALAGVSLLFFLASLLLTLAPSGYFENDREIRAKAELLGVHTDVVGHSLGWIGVLAAAVCTALYLGAMSRSGRIAIKVDENGVYKERWSQKTIAWSSVEKIDLLNVGRTAATVVTIRDPEQYAPPGVLANLFRSSRRVVLTTSGTDGRPDELRMAIDRFSQRGRASTGCR